MPLYPGKDYSTTDMHQKLITAKELSLTDLPPCYQHSSEMLNLIKSLADLTVKIEVKGVSEQRKQYWANVESQKVIDNLRPLDIMFGSGKVDDVLFCTEKDSQCPCTECLKCPQTKWGEILIVTSAQLLYDDDDAKHFSCTLFYDDDQQMSTLKYVTGDRVVTRKLERDLCMFICATCDLNLLHKLESMLDRFEQCWEDAFEKYVHGGVKWVDERLIVTVSHPYGGRKYVSLGKKKSETDDSANKAINYDTPTCKGSTGAYVLVPDFDLSDHM
jgi:hypothetical protein